MVKFDSKEEPRRDYSSLIYSLSHLKQYPNQLGAIQPIFSLPTTIYQVTKH